MKNLLKLAIMGFLVIGNVQAATYNVTVNGFTYNSDMPIISESKVIQGGDRVNFQASFGAPMSHPLRFDLNDFANGGAGCNSNCSFIFPNPSPANQINSFNYYCANHGSTGGFGMVGTFQVVTNNDLIFINDFETPVIPESVITP